MKIGSGKRRSKPLLDEYKKNMKDKGLPGEEVLSFYLQTIYKYQK